jgi:hypothetical protein
MVRRCSRRSRTSAAAAISVIRLGPSCRTYQPKRRDLARVGVDFRDDPADEVDEYRFDISPYTNTKVGYTILSRADRNRTDWVTADGVKWMSEANIARKTLQYERARF